MDKQVITPVIKKALIVSPYLDHLGGGERYMLSVASVVEELGFTVYFAWNSLDTVASLTNLLVIPLRDPKIDIHVLPHYFSHNPIAMHKATSGYDLVVYLSDGSIPWLGGKKNIMHMQVPFHGVHGRSLVNKIKLSSIHAVIVNSRFTKTVVDKEYGIDATVVYPPVVPVMPGRKENLILSVGRFEHSLNVKRQDALIEAFRLVSPILPGWRLALAGGVGEHDYEWLGKLKMAAAGLPVQFYENVAHEKLLSLYKKAKVYWHAAGYQVDELLHPELTEHFGISTVEAISAGCTPLVVGKGGQREIVKDETYYWSSLGELAEKTAQAAAGTIAPPAIDTTAFSRDNFKKSLETLLA